MDTKNKESKGSSATASKTTATGSQAAGITPQQTHGMAGAPHDQTSQQKQQNQDAARQMGSEGQQQPPA